MNLTPLTEAFSVVAAVSWRASWVIAVLAALRLAVRGRIPAQVWFGVWIVVALRLVIPFSVPTSWSPYNLAGSRALKQPADAPPPPTGTSGQAGVARRGSVVADAELDLAASAAKPAAGWTGREAMGVVWLAGAVVLLAGRAAASWKFRRQLTRASALADGRVAATLAREAAAWHIDRRVVAVETGAVDAPALFGLLEPRLLFPPGFAPQLTDDELRLVVRHELAHWRRGDLPAQWLMQAALMVHWFNPLVWLAARLARMDCEPACDEFVLRREAAGGAGSYGATLLKVLGVVRGRRRPGSVVAILEGRQQLAERVRLIADYQTTTFARVLGGVALVAVLAAGSMTRETRAEANSVDPVATDSRPEPSATAAPAAENHALTITESERKAKMDRTERAFAELKPAVEAQKEKVAQLARELQAMKEKQGFISTDTRRDIAADTLKALASEVHAAETADGIAEVKLDQLNDYRARGADLKDLPFVGNQPAVAQLVQRVAAARTTLLGLSERYLEKHPLVVNAKGELAASENELQRVVDTVCRQLAAEADMARRNLERARQAFERAKADSIAFEREAQSYFGKERELQAQEQKLQELTAQARNVGDGGTTVEAAVTIEIDKDGVIFVNGRQAADDALPGLLGQAHGVDTDAPVLIKASEKTPLNKLTFVMDACRTAGLNKLSLQSR